MFPPARSGSARRHTSSELVAEAHARGFEASRDLIRDWVQAGLLGRPTAGRGLGQGKGRAQGTWPDEQRQLFLELLWQRQRAEVAPSVGALCNIPVWTWLTRDPEVVAQDQVRRALITWATAPRRRSDDAVIADATSAVDRLVAPGARRGDRLKLRIALTDRAMGRELNPTWLIERIRNVTGPFRPSAAEQPDGDGLTAERFVARAWALEVDKSELARLTDENLGAARTYYRERVLSDDPKLPSSACRHLVLIARLLALEIGIEAWSGHQVRRQ